MLLDKYKPKNLKEVIGNARQINEIKAWLAKPKGALLIHGPPGCGKSLSIELIAEELGYELVESHAADARGYKDMKASIGKAAAQYSLFYKKKLILIDELELIDSAKGVVEIVQESKWPVILVASNPYEQKLAQLRKSCTLVKFDKIRTDSIESLLRRVCAAEGIEMGNDLSQLSKTSNGDVRAAVIDLECAAVKADVYRDKEDSIFETLKILFKTMNLGNSRYAVSSSEKSPEEIFLWLEENIPLEYENPSEIAAAYDWLAKADIIAARIMRRQSWSLQKYYADFLSGVSFAKRETYRKFTPYAFPRMRSKGKELLPIAEKLSRKLHVSKKASLQYIQLISIIKNDNVRKELGLTEEELEMLD